MEGKNNIGWTLYENGDVHTNNLDEASAQEMLDRYTGLYPGLEYSIECTGYTSTQTTCGKALISCSF